MRVLCVHSPLVGPSTWRPLAGVARADGHDVVVPDLRPALEEGVDGFVRLATQGAPEAPVVLGHSRAGAFLPAIGAGTGATALVFVDAVVPPVEGAFTPAPHTRALIADLVEPDGFLPPWTSWWSAEVLAELLPDPALRHDVEADTPRVPLAFSEAPVAVPSGWHRAPAAYLQLSPAYDDDAAEAVARGWPVERIEGHHLDLVTRPGLVWEAVTGLLARLAV